MFKFGKVTVNKDAITTQKAKKNKKGTVDIKSIPDPEAFTRQSVGRKFPDCVFYDGKKTGSSAVTILGEVKGYTGRDYFTATEIGQLTDGMRRLMKLQPFRRSMIGFLTDGSRFVFVRCEKRYPDEFRFQHSSVFHKQHGWQVCIHQSVGIMIELLYGEHYFLFLLYILYRCYSA